MKDPTHNLNMWDASNTWIKLPKVTGIGIKWYYAENKNLVAHECLCIEDAWHAHESPRNEWIHDMVMHNGLE